jgi:hypothetical protein
MREAPLNLEHIWSMAMIDRLIHFIAQRCHCQSIIVSTDIFPKFLCLGSLTSKQIIQLSRKIMKLCKFDLSLKTTHAKLWTGIGSGTTFLPSNAMHHSENMEYPFYPKNEQAIKD